MNENCIIIFVSCASKKEARTIADELLRKRLVACANILDGVESKFWWNGKIEKAPEALVTFKTSAVKFKAIQKEVRRLHSYEVPEVIATPIIDGSKEYLQWIKKSIK